MAGAVTPADTPELESLADRFVQAWNTHDTSVFKKLFVASAYWVPTVDSRLDGRDNILADLGKAHETWARTTTMGINSGSISTRFVHPDVAVVLFQAGFRQADGTLTTPGNAVLLVAVKQSDGWQIAAGQITKPGSTIKPR
jgi:uncharacterized protein (TIGR02246 family)